MPVTNTLGFNADSIQKQGADKIAFRIVTATGAQSGSETWFDGVYRAKSTITFEQPEEEIKGESGDVLATEQGDVKAEIKITSLQSDSNLYNFLINDVATRYFACFMELGQTGSNQTQFCYIPLAKIQRGFSVNAPGREVDITIKPLANPSAFTGASLSAGSVTAWSTYSGSLSASVSGSVGTYMVVRSA